MLGDCSKAKEKLGWKLEMSFDNLVQEMCEGDTWTSDEIMSRKLFKRIQKLDKDTN